MRARFLGMAVLGASMLAGPASGQPADEAEALRQRIADLQAELENTKAELAEVLKAQPVEDPAGTTATPPSDDNPEVSVPADEDTPAEAPAPAEVVEPPEAVAAEGWRLPAWLRDWKSSVELGINGTEGNTRNQALRFVFQTRRNTERTETSVNSLFRMTSQDGADSLKQFTLNARNDWLNPGTNDFRYFVQGKLEFDDAQPWDSRVSGFGGIGYALIKDDKTTLLARSGFGGSKRVGIEDDEFRAEAFLAADLTHAISERQKFQAGFEYLPNTDGWQEYRLNADASWELKIDPKNDLYLRMGVANRFDSDHGSARPNDLDYFVNLGWTF